MKASNVHQPSKIEVNPAVLIWAREWRGRTIEEAASKVRKQARDIVNWEHGIGSPTVKQARTLAEYYGRPFLELYLDAPPVVPVSELAPDYRMHAGTKSQSRDRDLQFLQQWAETTRLDALSLCAEIGVDVPEFPSRLFSTTASNPEEVAERVREAMGFPIHEQIAMTKSESRSLASILRRKIEDLGVLTLRRADLKEFNARGICLVQFPLPVIVVQNESVTAQAFTLMHEFGHILLGQSAITGERRQSRDKQPVEYWCDRFAASFLMPSNQIAALIGPKPSLPLGSIEDADLARHADIFRVSPHAMLIRLVQLGYVVESYYWTVKKPQFDKEEREARSFGRAPYYGVRYRSQLGDFYTGLVLEAWTSGKITNHHAAEYMGIKRIDHLEDIRREFARP